jgi:hypothetical protein
MWYSVKRKIGQENRLKKNRHRWRFLGILQDLVGAT